jgi:hypothetical protein
MASFDTKAISYRETRADNGVDWDVRYDLSFLNSEVLTTLKIRLVGDDPGSRAGEWEASINRTWNNKVCFSDGSRLYEVKVNCDFVDSGAHQTVEVHAGYDDMNMTNWYLDESLMAASHEVGHMLGNFDEYSAGATFRGYTTTSTLMSDVVARGFEKYFWTQEYYTEQNSGLALSTVLTIAKTAGSDAFVGTGGMDGMYGLGGDDTINGGGGNDLIDGGAGFDDLTGGTGADIFDYDSAGEASTNYIVLGDPSPTHDVIRDFQPGVDKIDLSGMDASSSLAGNNTFVWRGTAGFGPSADGELRYQRYDNAGTESDYTMVFGDTDNDAIFEFQIRLDGLHNLGAADFYL